jgi:uncharacterized protein DUF4349
MGCVTSPSEQAGQRTEKDMIGTRCGSRRSRVAAAGAVASVVALVGLSGCSGGVTGAGSQSDSAGAVSSDEAPRAAGPATDSRAGSSNRTAVRAKAVIRTGQISLTSNHLTGVRSEVDDLLRSIGGSVDREDTSNDRHGRVERVPVGSFDTARKALSRLGKVVSSTESEKDVTTQVIDTAERVETLQNSLDRLQKFQRSAKDVGDLIRFEDQITSRQAELQSLKAQQSYLASQTSMSTITLELARPDKQVTPPGPLDDAGFLAGLKAGWHTLVGIGVVALTVAGALLPFLVVLALVGGPAWLVVRRLLATRRGVITARDTQ